MVDQGGATETVDDIGTPSNEPMRVGTPA